MINLPNWILSKLGITNNDEDHDDKLSASDTLTFAGKTVKAEQNLTDYNSLSAFFDKFDDGNNRFWITNFEGDFQIHRYFSESPLWYIRKTTTHHMAVLETNDQSASFHDLQTKDHGMAYSKTTQTYCGNPSNTEMLRYYNELSSQCNNGSMTQDLNIAHFFKNQCFDAAQSFSETAIEAGSLSFWGASLEKYKKYIEAQRMFATTIMFLQLEADCACPPQECEVE